jgi:hypothetical protein
LPEAVEEVGRHIDRAEDVFLTARTL